MLSSGISLRTVQALCLAASLASAQTEGFDAITKPTKDENVSAGSDYNIVWDYDSSHPGTVYLSLLEGDSSTTLQVGPNITTGVQSSAGSYLWSVDGSLGADATYGIKLTLEADPSVFQYSNPFHIVAADAASTAVDAAATGSAGSRAAFRDTGTEAAAAASSSGTAFRHKPIPNRIGGGVVHDDAWMQEHRTRRLG